jgi:hypothetical protein
MQSKHHPLLTVVKVLGIIVLVVVLLVVVLLGALTVFEYRPADKESLDITGSSLKCPASGDTITIESWNVG